MLNRSLILINGIIFKTVKNDYRDTFKLYPYITCQNFPAFHTTCWYGKKRKSKEERNMISHKPRSLLKDKNDKINVVPIWRNMTIGELASSMNRSVDDIFEISLFVENSNDYDDVNSPIDDLKVIQDIVKKGGLRFCFGKPEMERLSEEAEDKNIYKRPPPSDSDLRPRPPVVTIMGHVDHGKTTLLDTLRHSSIVETEFGGITQHIGAFSVKLDSSQTVTFLDTPGHAAFSAMRARGAHVTDMVVLVVAADDGVMEQTIESVRYAVLAGVPIIVAINKIDKPGAKISATIEMLLNCGLQLESQGGDVQCVEISALKGINIDLLVETLNTQAELMHLSGDPKGMVEGAVIESKVDPGRGKVATCLVQRGTLRKGAFLTAGDAWCKVRNLFDENGRAVLFASLSSAVQVIGWRDLPSAGDEIIEVESEKQAIEVVNWRKKQKLQEKLKMDKVFIDTKLEEHQKVYRAELEELRKKGIRYKSKKKGHLSKQVNVDEGPQVSIVIKGDVDGTVEAILDILDTYHSSQCKLDVLSYGVGDVTESDIIMAESFNGSIYTFNVNASKPVAKMAQSMGVTIKHNNVIYKLISDLRDEISRKLPPKKIEEIVGEADVIIEFVITEGKSKIPVAGCRCTKGVLKKDLLYRVTRNQETIYEGTLFSMRHLKSEVKSIAKGMECGLRFEDGNIRFENGDVIVCYEIGEVEQVTDWDTGF